jgi:putative ABC transport system permease protein
MTIAPATRALTRLAWRELSRSPRRSALTIALVALPVAALTVAAVLVASSTANHDTRRGLMGSADAVVLLHHSADASRGDVTAEYLRRLPAGSRVLRLREYGAPVPGVRGSEAFVEVSDLPLDDPLTAGMTKLLRGRLPAGPGEIAAAPNVLRDLGLRVGDRLVSHRLGLHARITAEVIDPTNVARSRVITGGPLPHVPQHRIDTRLLLAVPAGTPASTIERLDGPGRTVIGAGGCCPAVAGIDDRGLARESILVMSAIALLIVGLVIAAAFAISARRRLRVIGLLGAAAGADRRHVRHLSVLEGTLCGGAGVIAGFALGLAVVAILDAPGIDAVANPVTGRVTFPLLELALIAAMAVAATAAGAWLPGRSAARTGVLAALGGRRPLRRVPATLPLRGLMTSAAGTVLMAVALNAGSPWGLSLAGAVLIVLGFVLCASALIAVLESLARRGRGVTRLAARDIARQRARTGPLVAAILAVTSLALLGSTIIDAERARSGDPNDHGIGRDQVVLRAGRGQIAVPPAVRTRVRALLPAAIEAQMGIDRRASADIAIGGPRLLAALGAGAGRTALERGEAVVLRPGRIEDGRVRIGLAGARGQVRVPAVEVPVDRPQRQLFASIVVSERTAARAGLRPTVTDVVLRAPAALTAEQRGALRALAISIDRGAPPAAAAEITVAGTPQPDEIAATLATLLTITAALTLAVVAIGLALSAAEGKDDDTVLAALGADPAIRRRLRATQAAMLVGIGGLLAVPAGLIPAAVIIVQGNDIEGAPLRFAVPWPAVAVVLLALPAVAAAGAWLLTRPTRWSPPASWAD